jgi:hypothetical protein
MYSVNQEWDPLKVCVLGRSYPPEFYGWIKQPHVRELFERIARETEEDYQIIQKKLEEFGIKVMRPNTLDRSFDFSKGSPFPPPMVPRDIMVMMGNTLHTSWYIGDRSHHTSFPSAYAAVRDPSWPDCGSWEEFKQLPDLIRDECITLHGFDQIRMMDPEWQYQHIIKDVQDQGNTIKQTYPWLNGAMCSKIGRDLYFGTRNYNDDIALIKQQADQEFPDYRNHVVNTGGHSDGTYCPVCPGLIFSLRDIPTYAETYPGWEVVYLQNQGWDGLPEWRDLKIKNNGRWWIPGFERDDAVIDLVENWLGNWMGYVEETVFDVNMLMLDPKNVLVLGYNEVVWRTLERYGITPHIVPFRHRFFWDGGLHCITADLNRQGGIVDFFPDRK